MICDGGWGLLLGMACLCVFIVFLFGFGLALVVVGQACHFILALCPMFGGLLVSGDWFLFLLGWFRI